MKSGLPETHRRLVPRWRSFTHTVSGEELRSVGGDTSPIIAPENSNTLSQLTNEWNQEKSLESAAELVSCGIVLNNHQCVQEAARFILDECDARPAVVYSAQLALGEHSDTGSAHEQFLFDQSSYYLQIAKLKARVRVNPADSITWVELARCYTILGQDDKAKHALRVAVSISPNNRHVLRSLSRFCVHKDKPSEGLYYLRSSKATRQDPWLLAAEIALSEIAGTGSVELKNAMQRVSKSGWVPWDLTELCGSIGVSLIANGADKKAKKYFKQSGQKPTENALAQLHFESNLGRFSRPGTQIESSIAPEAMAHYFRSQMMWEDCLTACDAWRIMEPFSTRPLRMASYICLVALRDGLRAIDYLKTQLVLEPNCLILNNDVAVAHAYAGDCAAAEKALEIAIAAEPGGKPTIAMEATKGLIAYQRGVVEKGRAYYISSMELADEEGSPESKLMAIWHMLSEESRLGTSGLNKLVKDLERKSHPLLARNYELREMKNTISRTIDTNGTTKKVDFSILHSHLI